MALEFYDPRRPAQELLEDITDVVRDMIAATEEYSLREIRLERSWTAPGAATWAT